MGAADRAFVPVAIKNLKDEQKDDSVSLPRDFKEIWSYSF